MDRHAAAGYDETTSQSHHSLREQIGQLVDRERVLIGENDQLRAQLVEMKEQEKKKYDDLMVQYNMKREYEDDGLNRDGTTNQVTVKTEWDDEVKQEIKEEYEEDHDIFIKREYVPTYIKTESNDEDVKDIIKQEIKEEYDEDDHDDDYGFDLRLVKKELVSDDDDSSMQIDEVIQANLAEPKDILSHHSIIDTNIKTEDASNSQQSVQMCKRVKMEQDAQYITDWEGDRGSDDCIVKQEIKEELVETCQLDPNNGQSVQLGTRVKKEEETSDDENVEVQVALDGGEGLNHNRQESLPEQSNGTNQGSVNDQHVDKGNNEPNEPDNDGQNESPTSKQSKTRKRSRADKSQVSENSSFENSLTCGEVSMNGPMTSSKRTRESVSLDRLQNAEQLSSGSRVDLSEGDNQNGIDSSGEEEKGVEQSEDDDDETELAEEDEGGHYKIEIVKLKCTEDGCGDEVADRDELHDHLRVIHHISPYRCLAQGCNERFEQWGGLGKHVQDNHSNISTWPCLHCTKTFKSHHFLYKHLHFYHYEGQFKCGYDGCHYDRVATHRSEINKHQQSVHPKTTNSTIFTCLFPNCGMSFNHKGNFNAHQRIHQKVKPYKCTWNMCDYASTQQSAVIRHIRTQHFHLPATQKKQHQLGIEDNRNPHDYLLKEHNN